MYVVVAGTESSKLPDLKAFALLVEALVLRTIRFLQFILTRA
jgi:hypothetical protein